MRVFLPYVSVLFLLPTLPAQIDPQQWVTVRGQLLLNRDARLLVARLSPYAQPPKREFVESWLRRLTPRGAP